MTDPIGKTIHDNVMSGITSLAPRNPVWNGFLKSIVDTGGIDNKVHYVRYVAYDEYRCRIRTKFALGHGVAPQSCHGHSAPSDTE